MSKKRDFYEVLGLNRDAQEKEIKKAYRKMARKYHPDGNQGDKDAEKKFKEINEAYGVLSDPEKKKLYDQFGMAAFDESGASSSQGAWNGNPFGNGYADPFGAYRTHAGTDSYGSQGDGGTYQSFHFDADDPRIKEMFGDLFGGMFHESGTGTGSNSSAGSQGFGYQSGSSGYRNPFEGGFSSSFRNAGFEDGNRSYQAPEKLDLQKDLFIPFTMAVFGGEARVATPDGSVMLKIPPGCQCGRKFRLAGKGKKSRSGTARGDLYVVIQINVPKDLSAGEVRKLREYEHIRKEKSAQKETKGQPGKESRQSGRSGRQTESGRQTNRNGKNEKNPAA